MITFPNAKINLGLTVTERRKDNFHNLETVFYPVPWHDVLEILPASRFEFNTSGILLEGDPEENLCVRVFKALQAAFSLPPVRMHLHKAIPAGAGLGGGSSDAAFTLKTLNELFDLHLTSGQMEDFIRPFGSDCAFFVRNQPVFAHGKGDLFENVPVNLSGMWIAMIYPALHISTREAYAGITPAIPGQSVKDIIRTPVSLWRNTLVNDFERSVFPNHPVLPGIKERLYSLGAVYASMSGSGSTLFGIFDAPVDLSGIFPREYLVKTGFLG